MDATPEGRSMRRFPNLVCLMPPTPLSHATLRISCTAKGLGRPTCCSTAECCGPNLVRERILEVLNQWLPQPVTSLSSDDLMHAVARGAAYYGLARQGKGVRVRGGVPRRSYYIGIETAMPAVPGMKPPPEGAHGDSIRHGRGRRSTDQGSPVRFAHRRARAFPPVFIDGPEAGRAGRYARRDCP